MHLTLEQIHADNAKMKSYICQRISKAGQRVVLSDFSDWPEPPAAEAWVDLCPVWDDRDGWDLHVETNCRESVSIRGIYDHFRRKDMTSWEWRRELQGDFARAKANQLEGALEELRSAMDRQPSVGKRRTTDAMLPDDLLKLPPELTTAQAAKVLGICKDTVLRFKDDGVLEYRNAAPPSSSRPIFLFSLESVLTLRTGYQTESPPLPFRKTEGPRRTVKGPKKYKHLREFDD